MKFIDPHKNKTYYSSQNTSQLTLESIQMIATNQGMRLAIETPFLKKNTCKIDIRDQMLYVGMMIPKIISDKKYSFKKYFKHTFIEGYIALPYRKQLQIDTIKYATGLLRIQLIEKSKRSHKNPNDNPSKTHICFQNNTENLQLTY